jgi:hypothetical protein
MSERDPNPNPAATLDAGPPQGRPAGPVGPLRIVLFGLPDAGKSTLLAALAQVQHAQPSLLQGELSDDSGGLARQRQLFYDELPRPTEQETVGYPVHFRPPGRRATPYEALLVDSDGRVVEHMLGQEPPAAEDSPPGTLPHAVLDADALVLALDASSPPEESEQVFSDFADFLRRFERDRGDFNEATGLPVFVVLTKCDLLAQRQDSTADWMERIEERKRQLSAQLKELLGEAEGRPRDFGRLDLHLWATAARRPALAAAPARPREPYGVAELFRQCLNEAGAFRGRRRTAERRLAWGLGSTSSAAAGLFALIVVLLTGLGEHHPSELEIRIERYRLREGSTITRRLNNWPQELEERQQELAGFRRDPEFSAVPADLRKFVKGRLAELEDYIPYLKKVLKEPFPSSIHNDEELRNSRRDLEEKLTLPRPEWAESGAGQLRQQRLDDLRLLAERTTAAERWFQDRRREGVSLYTFRGFARGPRIDWRGWQNAVSRFIAQATAPAPATQHFPLSSLVTPSTVLDFDRVHRAREQALSSVRDLKAVLDISSVLGLGPSIRERPALLSIRRPFPPASARRRWQRLAGNPALAGSVVGLLAPAGPGPLLVAAGFFPGHPLVQPYPDFREEFVLSRVPDAARAEVKEAANNNYQDVLAPLRDAIRDRYRELSRGAAETPAQWRAVGDWLATDPPELASYRGLTGVLDRLRRANARDPVTALASFLRIKEFSFSVSGARLEVPFDAGVSLPDDAVLVFQVGRRALRFPLDFSQTKTDAQERVTSYFFKGPLQPVTYRPGDPCEVSLALRRGKVLTWQGKGTYAFEAISRPPSLHDRDQPAGRGVVVEGVVLRPTLAAGEAFPQLPDAFPSLRDSDRQD